jgi:rfaE bifunctional protein nucleotidyltransferase chain/domain
MGSKEQPPAKILSLKELASIIENLRGKGKTVVHCHGVFDLLHPGHIRHFAAARKEGDVLVVTITPDHFVNKGPGRPAFPAELRAESLAALKDVDFVAINQWPTAVETIELLKPDVYVKDQEYRDPKKDITGKIAEERSAIERIGGRMHFTEEQTFSSSSIINEHFEILPSETKHYLAGFRNAHSLSEIHDLLQSFGDLRVLVVGDAIIDEYVTCKAIGMASKSVTINARYTGEEGYAGGALAIANHVAGFCNNVQLLTCLGSTDDRRAFIEEHLKPNVAATFITRDDGPTTVKRRYLDPFRVQKMFEVTHMEDRPLPIEAEERLHKALKSLLSSVDVVLVADFGHGMLSGKSVEILSAAKCFLALNAQTNSANMGFNPVTKYGRADYACIDERELRIAYHDRFGNADDLARRILSDLRTPIATVTLGQKGSKTYAKTDTATTPVFCTEVVDTVGAGDAFFSLAALAASKGADSDLVGFLGNAAGAIASRILGNKESVEPISFAKFVTTLLK